MSYETYIARKHLTRRRKAGFISLISMISVMGVAVGVMALIVVLSVMSGFDRELKRKIVNVQPHLRIEKIGGVENAQEIINGISAKRIPGLINMSRFVEGQAMIRSDAGASGVLVKGLDVSREDMTPYEKNLVKGSLDLRNITEKQTRRKMIVFKQTKIETTGSILIGDNLARILGVGIGDEVSLVAPGQNNSKSRNLLSQVNTEKFTVSGIFRIGMNDFDASLAIIRLENAQKLYGLNQRVSGISLRFHDVDLAHRWKIWLWQDFGSNYVVRSWYDLNQSFFQALQVEKSVMTILLALIILVAAFNIVSTLTMVVMEKTKDIGILRAIGATRSGIGRIFIIEGFIVGFVGVAIGTLSGLWIASNLNTVSDFIKKVTGFELFPSDIYYFDRIPVEIHADEVLWVVAFSILTALLAGFYPSRRAAKLDPIEALRYE